MNGDAQTWINALQLRSRRVLSGEEAAAIASLPIRPRQLAADEHLSREGDPSIRCAYVIDGALYQTKLTRGGDRQIVGLLVRASPFWRLIGTTNELVGNRRDSANFSLG